MPPNQNIKQRGYIRRHKPLFIALGIVLGTATGTGYKVVSDARAEAAAARAMATAAQQFVSPDVNWVEFHKDVIDLRGEIREERRARESLTNQMIEFNGRLSKLEAGKR